MSSIFRDPRAVLVLFAGGADGWGVGLQRAGYNIVALAESDPDRRAVLRKRHPEAVIYEDVCAVTAERLVRDLGYLPGVVVGSPPCQDISCANNGKAKGLDGERSGLYFEFIRIVGEVRPYWYAAENSAFVKTRGFDRLHAAMGAVGYTCWPSVVGAVHAGFFHLRKRSWLAGIDVSRAQEEPMGAAGQPWARAPNAADTDLDRELQPQGRIREIGRRPGDCDPGSGADANRSDAERRPEAGRRGAWQEEGEGDAGDPYEGRSGQGRLLRERQPDAGRPGIGPDAHAGEARGAEAGHLVASARGATRGEPEAHLQPRCRGLEAGATGADTDEGGCGGLPRPGPRGWSEEAALELPAHLSGLEHAACRLGLGGRTRLGDHYRMAHGFRARLVAAGVAAGNTHRAAVKAWTDHARACVSAYGDALVPDIAEAFGHTMPQLLAELGA